MCPSDRMVRPITAANPDLRPAFEVIDVDGDGKISSDDLRIFYAGIPRSSAANDHDEIIGTMMTMADLNNDGFVEYEEFEKVLEGYNGTKITCSGGSNDGDGGGLMEDVFRMMDMDGDGRLSYDDLKSYMEWAGVAASDDEITAMIRLAGGSQKDGVSFDGLLKIFGC